MSSPTETKDKLLNHVILQKNQITKYNAIMLTKYQLLSHVEMQR